MLGFESHQTQSYNNLLLYEVPTHREKNLSMEFMIGTQTQQIEKMIAMTRYELLLTNQQKQFITNQSRSRLMHQN